MTPLQDRYVARAFAVATLKDAGFTHFQREDGSTVKLEDLIEHDLADAPTSPCDSDTRRMAETEGLGSKTE